MGAAAGLTVHWDDMLFGPFAVLARWPWLGLIPVAVFAMLHRVVRGRSAAVAAACWLVYTIYEVGVSRRWLCSGDCNIRVDLLLIAPVLWLISVIALLSMALDKFFRERPG